MPIQQIGLAASLFAGVLFLLASLRRAGPAVAPAPTRDIYWPLLLGTGERDFTLAMRLEIVRQVARENAQWREPILLCAREQESDAQILAAIERALGDAIKPVIGAP